MKNLCSYIVKLFLVAICLLSYQSTFAFETIHELPADSVTPLYSLTSLKQKMMVSEPRCCLPYLKDLDLVKVKYWGFDDIEHVGVIIIHRELSQELLGIFQMLYQHRFPIAQIHPSGSQPDMTIGYSCRAVTNQAGILSQHSFGRAIDINPLVNPYVKGKQVIPKEGQRYIDRRMQQKGMIAKNSLIHILFTERGWDWGGNWLDVSDYQHFEKRANGEKRNPLGYSLNR